MHLSVDTAAATQELRALIYYLVAVAHLDRDYTQSEREIVRRRVRALCEARVDDNYRQANDLARRAAIREVLAYFDGMADQIELEIRRIVDESAGPGMSTHDFVLARLERTCFEALSKLGEANRRAVLAAGESLAAADGRVDAGETRFRDRMVQLLAIPGASVPAPLPGPVLPAISVTRAPAPRASNHPFLSRMERPFAAGDATGADQVQADQQRVTRVIDTLTRRREAGRGRLGAARDVRAFAGQTAFLDGFVEVVPPRAGQDYELIVLGDLHGCYGCLKAAVMQSDFFAKVAAHRADPARHPATKLVLLGDYIDRGRFSFDGVLRAALEIYLAAPDDVYLLRGNHEWFLAGADGITAAVRPADALDAARGVVPESLIEAYHRLFESLPTSLIFDRLLMVHAGIPKERTLRQRWRDLSSLNDGVIRLEMMWSDLSPADEIPESMQDESARFPFGRRQFDRFLSSIGCTTMIRGHERVDNGFDVVRGTASQVVTVFSAGGEDNLDLPAGSSYRDVTPMALTIHHRDGDTRLAAWPIDFARYNDACHNGFHAAAPDQGRATPHAAATSSR